MTEKANIFMCLQNNPTWRMLTKHAGGPKAGNICLPRAMVMEKFNFYIIWTCVEHQPYTSTFAESKEKTSITKSEWDTLL